MTPLSHYCQNAVFCGNHAVIGESLCRDCLTREAEARERKQGRADAKIYRILKWLAAKLSRASHLSACEHAQADERKAGLK